MSSHPGKDGDNTDIPGMTTRVKSQQPLISNLFNSHVNLPYRVAKATRDMSIIHPQQRIQTLASPEKGSGKRVTLSSSPLGDSNGQPSRKINHGNSTTSLSASLARKDAIRKSREYDDNNNSRENDDNINLGKDSAGEDKTSGGVNPIRLNRGVKVKAKKQTKDDSLINSRENDDTLPPSAENEQVTIPVEAPASNSVVNY